MSYLEIYNEQLFDLLSAGADFEANSAMTVVEDDNGCVNVKGLSCHLAQTEEEALNFLFEVHITLKHDDFSSNMKILLDTNIQLVNVTHE